MKDDFELNDAEQRRASFALNRAARHQANLHQQPRQETRNILGEKPTLEVKQEEPKPVNKKSSLIDLLKPKKEENHENTRDIKIAELLDSLEKSDGNVLDILNALNADDHQSKVDEGRRIINLIKPQEKKEDDKNIEKPRVEEINDNKKPQIIPVAQEPKVEEIKNNQINEVKLDRLNDKPNDPVMEKVDKLIENAAKPTNEKIELIDSSKVTVVKDKDKKKQKVKKPRKEFKLFKSSKTNSDNTPSKEVIKQSKERNTRPKARKSTLAFAIIISIILFVGVCGVIGAGLFAYKLCDDKPTLNVSDLVSPDSSTIYDNEGNKIMQVGMYLRENIDYEEMPNCLIDAFLAVEDSRFFEHVGFDIPRFTKAILANLSSGDFSQGGSTITMQLIKNSYFSIDAGSDSTIASREGMSGIKRKMQEIVLSLQLELMTDTKKQDIIAMYINKVNYGNNIRGIEKAAEYYFGKSASQLNLGESAFLAGIINSPNAYNPYNDLYKYNSEYLSEDIDYTENATERRNEVLNLMVQHGYISEEESKLAKSVKIEDMLTGASDDFGSTNEKYQWYIDAVIDEVEEMTGESPYEVGMDIYTNMNPYMQEYLYDVQNEAEYTGISFPNELCQSAVVLMDNQTGAVEALGGGRGEIDSARKFNRATSAYLNPGSSMKPVVDYSLAIEKLGWATSHTITDMPYYLYDGPILISNFDHTYYGDMMMTEALGRSQNTPAVQTLVAVVDEIGEEGVVDYLNSIGFKFEYEDFDLQFAIGGNRCLATPEQMAGAHAIFMNGGIYIKPHTINYIKYVDGRDDYVADTVGTRALSEETAWMTAYLERYNMEGSFSSLMWYCKRDYPLYGKTGTTDWADAGVDYGIPVSATKDSWLIMQTNRYTISCWTGYDTLQKGAYFTTAEYQENTKSKIVAALLDELETHATYKDYDPSIEMEMPDGVVEISHVKGTYPYAKSGGEMVKGYTSKAALEKVPQGTIEDAMAYSATKKKYVDAGVSNIIGTYDGNTLSVTFSVEAGEGGLISGESVDLSSSNVLNETTHAVGPVWFPHWNTIYLGAATPPFSYRVEVNDVVTAEGSTDGFTFQAAAPGGKVAKACIWSADGSEVCQEFPINAE